MAMAMTMMMRSNSPALAQEPHAPWHYSPVSYLFGGLVAMLGFIAFAFLIRLAYSFCKLEEEERRRDLEAQKKAPPPPPRHQLQEEKIFVVMAGEERPTFLATPKCPSTYSSSSFGGNNISSSSSACACIDIKTDQRTVGAVVPAAALGRTDRVLDLPQQRWERNKTLTPEYVGRGIKP